MATASTVSRVLLVTLTGEETALWRRGDTQEAAQYRLTIKRPMRRAMLDAGLAKVVYVDSTGAFLEDSATHARACDPRTIQARCEVRDAWFPMLPPSERRHDPKMRQTRAGLLSVAKDDADVYAWLLEAAIADSVSPDVDLDPSSATGAAVIEAANRRLLARAMGKEHEHA